MSADVEAPLSHRLKAFAYWALWVGVAFFTVYPATNWLTSRRHDKLALYWPGELDLPFVPGFIWFYMSMYVLFILPPFFLDPRELRRLGIELIAATSISGLLFLVFPAQLGFPRIVPTEPMYGALYANLFAIDKPHNLVPSLHVVYSVAITLAILRSARAYWRPLLWMWLTLILSSTVLVHQHHLLDVAAGLLLAVAATSYMGRKHAEEESRRRLAVGLVPDRTGR